MIRSLKRRLRAIEAQLGACPAATLTGCACRWDGENYVEKCDFHAAWETAIREWAERAKTAEAKLASAPLGERRDADPIRELIAQHRQMVEGGNHHAYFELAYTRQTGWMAWLTDRPASGEPGTAAYAASRKVIARGQGDTAEEACADAIAAHAEKEGNRGQ